MALSLANIRGLLALAEHLSFRRAAEALNLGQPALSAQIRALEDAVGVALVSRTTRDVRLTPEGERFVAQMRRLTAEMDSVVAALRDPALLLAGRVAFSCIPTVAAHIFPKVIKRFRDKHPGVAIEMHDEETVRLERRILSREVDFGIGGVPRWRDELEFTRLAHDPFVLVCAKTHPLARRGKVHLEEALQYPLISLSKGSNIRATTETYLSRQGYSFSPAYSLKQHYTIGPMVEAQLGISLLPNTAAASLKVSPRLRVIPLDHPDFTRELGLIKRIGEPLTPVAEAFYQATAQALRGPAGKHMTSE
ncbi:LysR family transcriptional regulator [Pigmentiphaga sp.]|uniref:LysR family transcriptional regulator n=1 Tax=Pigmentiphaga sp. TaxID=1977564 RepID=UPI0025E7F645|nr:LysR family transcriptional regulator [Pigmentiphaga sp.]